MFYRIDADGFLHLLNLTHIPIVPKVASKSIVQLPTTLSVISTRLASFRPMMSVINDV